MKVLDTHIFFPVFLMAIFCCWGCTGIVTEEKEAPVNQEAAVKFSIARDAYRDNPPEKLQVVLSRIINSRHYSWQIDALSGETGTDSTAGPLKSGEYYLLAFGVDSNCVLKNLERFVTDNTISIKELVGTVKEMDADSLPVFEGEKWVDFNPGFTYLRPVRTLYADVIERQQLLKGDTTQIVLSPVPVTQKIRFRFTFHLEEGVEIVNIRGEISGIAREMELLSGVVSDSVTCRTIFDAREIVREGEEVLYEGEIHVLGLFPNPYDSYITGPGILHLSVCARAGDKQKIFHAGINLKRTIREAGLMVETPSLHCYKIAREESLLIIKTVLRIQADQIISGTANNGVEKWYDQDKIDVEV